MSVQAAKTLLNGNQIFDSETGAENQFGNLTMSGWRKLAELRQAVSSLETETLRWKEMTQVNLNL